MRLSDFAAIVKDDIVQRKHAIVLMPVFREYESIREHLAFLSAQDSQDFDLVIVMNAHTEGNRVMDILRSAKPAFGTAVIKRKEDTGSAGGFFTGQLYALEKGYQFQIFADADCYPTDTALVGSLIRAGHHGYVSHPVHNTVNGKRLLTTPATVIAQYCLLSSEIVRSMGLYYMPLYLDADDLEYMERIGRKPFVISNAATHPLPFSGLRNPDRYLRSKINTLTVSKNFRTLLMNFIITSALLPALALFAPGFGGKAHLSSLQCLLMHRYGKAAASAINSDFMDFVGTPAPGDGFAKAYYGSAFGSDSRGFVPLRAIRDSFRKDVEIEAVSSITLTLLVMLSSRRCRISLGNDKCLTLSDNRNPLLHALRLAAFAFCFPAIALLLLFVFLPQKIFFQPKTMRYGLG